MLKMIAIGYAVKTVLLGMAWLAVPDLPERATGAARRAWGWIAGAPTATTTDASPR